MFKKKTGRTGYGVTHLWSQHLRDRARRSRHVKFEDSLVYVVSSESALKTQAFKEKKKKKKLACLYSQHSGSRDKRTRNSKSALFT